MVYKTRLPVPIAAAGAEPMSGSLPRREADPLTRPVRFFIADSGLCGRYRPSSREHLRRDRAHAFALSDRVHLVGRAAPLRGIGSTLNSAFDATMA
jgi:hypothetical protein